MIFSKEAKTSGAIELKQNGAMIFGYSLVFRLSGPDTGKPSGDEVLVGANEEAGDFCGSAIGTSPTPMASDDGRTGS
ncbi:hypothetical protein CDD83_4834 [Cordyceps sp. RAO-2017]|nr:hypothetical protein CDD83_4834 [Cordyceps sp. RAO-2017]